MFTFNFGEINVDDLLSSMTPHVQTNEWHIICMGWQWFWNIFTFARARRAKCTNCIMLWWNMFHMLHTFKDDALFKIYLKIFGPTGLRSWSYMVGFYHSHPLICLDGIMEFMIIVRTTCWLNVILGINYVKRMLVWNVMHVVYATTTTTTITIRKLVP